MGLIGARIVGGIAKPANGRDGIVGRELGPGVALQTGLEDCNVVERILDTGIWRLTLRSEENPKPLRDVATGG